MRIDSRRKKYVNMKAQKTLKFLRILFAFIGLLFIVLAITFAIIDYRLGNSAKVYFTMLNPVFLIFFILGVTFFSVGFIMIIYERKSNTKHQMLRENGRKIYAAIEKINLNTSLRVNGKHPYIITCKWTDPATGNTYFFKSPNLWFNPHLIIAERNIDTLLVYIDRDNPKNYFDAAEELEKYTL